LRLVTFGTATHGLTAVAHEVIRSLEGVDHVDHIETRDRRSFLQSPNEAAASRHLAALEPDLFLSAGYGRILSAEVLAIPRIGAVNAHPSLLPSHRGLDAPYWVLYEGRSRAGVTIHEMTLPVDSGPIVAQAALDVDPDETPDSLYRRLFELARPLLASTLQEILRTRQIRSSPQPAGGSYRSHPSRELPRLEIDWSQPAPELIRRSRVFPAGANFSVGRWRVFVSGITQSSMTQRAPGTIVQRRPSRLTIAVGDKTSVELHLDRPLRAWAKLILTHTARHLRETGAARRPGPVSA
jgi:methionyl-tRNA formyltransferase